MNIAHIWSSFIGINNETKITNQMEMKNLIKHFFSDSSNANKSFNVYYNKIDPLDTVIEGKIKINNKKELFDFNCSENDSYINISN